MKQSAAATTPPEQRQGVLTGRRNLKMAESAHAYVRGSTVRFYDWLEDSRRVALPEGPAVWICGDCHAGNIGPVAGADGSIAVQVRDVDQTVIGNPAHDLVRLALSLAMAARGSDLPGVTTARMLEQMVLGYEQSFDAGEAPDAEAYHAPEKIRLAMKDAARRSWRHLAEDRIEGVAPAIPLGARFWPLTETERAAVGELFAGEAMRELVASLRSRDAQARIEMVDCAYWRKGCSSLGNLRLAVLVAVRDGEGKRPHHCLMDVKEAITAAAPRYAGRRMPRDNGERVVEGARHLSPHLGRRMHAARLLGKAVFVRELMPQDLKLDVERLSREEAGAMARFLAGVVGHAHARQMSAAERAVWRAELQRNRSATLDAPSWLWRAVVELVANHEAAYLEHCRRFALRAEAA